jgi:hypothetical protein
MSKLSKFKTGTRKKYSIYPVYPIKSRSRFYFLVLRLKQKRTPIYLLTKKLAPPTAALRKLWVDGSAKRSAMTEK